MSYILSDPPSCKVMSASREAMVPCMRNAVRAELEMIEPHDLLEREHLAEGTVAHLYHTVGLTAGHRDVSLWYVVEATRTQPITLDDQEFNSVQWFRFSEVPFERSDPHMRRFVEKLGSHRTLAISLRAPFA